LWRRLAIETAIRVQRPLSSYWIGSTARPSCRRYRSTHMNGKAIAALVVVATVGLGVASAQAGPCSSEIAQFEQAVRQSAGNPNAGPFARQSIGAQLHRQPTPRSIKPAEEQAQAAFDATLARAKELDAQGDRAGCTKALTDAKEMYNLQ